MADELIIDGDLIDLSAVGVRADGVIEHIQRIEAAIQKINTNPINLGSVNGMKELRDATEQLTKATQVLVTAINDVGKAKRSYAGAESASIKSQTDSANASKRQADAYTDLANRTKEAERNAKALAAEYGALDERTQAAARSAAELKAQLTAANSVVKNAGSLGGRSVESVPFQINTSDGPLKDEAQALIDAKDRLSEYDRELAESSIAATEWGAAQKTAAQSTQEITEVFSALTGRFDEYTGTIAENMVAQKENVVALRANRAEQNEIEASIQKSGAATQAQANRLTVLRDEEIKLIQINKELTSTINLQSKALTAEAGSAVQLESELSLLQQSYARLSAVDKASPFGQGMKKQIDILGPQVKGLDAEVGKFQKNVGNYGGAITNAFSSAFGFLRQIAYVLPGVGIAGILGAVSDVVIGFVSNLLKGKDALNSFADTYKTYTEVIKSSNLDAGKQISDLKILYNAATDVNQSMKTRLEAVQGLKKEFPDYFAAQKTEAILNGESKKSYDDLTTAIIASSRAKAADQALQTLASQRLDAENQKLKINTATYNEANRAREKYAKRPTIDFNFATAEERRLHDAGKLTEEQKKQILNRQREADVAGQVRLIEERKAKALKDQDDILTHIQSKEDFLVKFATVPNVVTAVTDKDKGKGGDVTKSLEERIKAEYDILEKSRRAKFELAKLEIQDEIDKQKAIANAGLDYISPQARERQLAEEKRKVDLETNYELHANDLKIASINAVRNAKLSNTKLNAAQIEEINASADKEIAAARLTAAEIQLIREKAKDKVVQLESNAATDIIAINKRIADNDRELAALSISNIEEGEARKQKERIDAEQKYLTTQQRNIQQGADERLTTLNNEYAAGKISKKQYEDEKVKIENDALKKSLQQQIQFYTFLVGLYEFDVDKKRDALAKIAALQKQLSGVGLGLDTKKTQDQANEIIGIASQLNTTLFDFMSAGSQNRINLIQNEQDKLEERYKREIDLINQTIPAGAARDQKLLEAEKRNQAQRRVLDIQERQEKIKKAQADKAAAIFSITLNTAKAIVADLGNPLKIVFDSIVGAAQLAIAIATPLPRFFRGKNTDSYEGYGWVDDGPTGNGNAPETIVRADGTIERGGNRPRLTWLGKNDIVLPTSKDLAWQATASIPGIAIGNSKGQDELKNELRYGFKNTVKAIKSMPGARLIMPDPVSIWMNKKPWKD